MKLTCLLTIVIVLVISLQNTESREVNQHFEVLSERTDQNEYPLTKYHYDQRGIQDLWNNIKNTAVKSWNFVKKLAQSTKQKLNTWAENVKNQANAITKAFEERIKTLKDKFYAIIGDVFGNEEVVKKCLEEGKKRIEKEFKEIVKKMLDCVRNQLKQLIQINGRQSQLIMNDTQFINELEEKLNMCSKNPENVEECLFTVRENVFKDTENLEDVILNEGIESRKIADGLLDNIGICTNDGLIEATGVITKEALKISKCVLEGKEKNEKSNSANLF